MTTPTTVVTPTISNLLNGMMTVEVRGDLAAKDVVTRIVEMMGECIQIEMVAEGVEATHIITCRPVVSSEPGVEVSFNGGSRNCSINYSGFTAHPAYIASGFIELFERFIAERVQMLLNVKFVKYDNQLKDLRRSQTLYEDVKAILIGRLQELSDNVFKEINGTFNTNLDGVEVTAFDRVVFNRSLAKVDVAEPAKQPKQPESKDMNHSGSHPNESFQDFGRLNFLISQMPDVAARNEALKLFDKITTESAIDRLVSSVNFIDSQIYSNICSGNTALNAALQNQRANLISEMECKAVTLQHSIIINGLKSRQRDIEGVARNANQAPYGSAPHLGQPYPINQGFAPHIPAPAQPWGNPTEYQQFGHRRENTHCGQPFGGAAGFPGRLGDNNMHLKLGRVMSALHSLTREVQRLTDEQNQQMGTQPGYNAPWHR